MRGPAAHDAHQPVTEGAPGTAIGDSLTESWLRTLDLNADFDRPWVDAAVTWLLSGSMPDVTVDVGCGAGGAACAFATALPAGSQVVAFDRDPRLVAKARRRAADEGVARQVRCAQADVERLPLTRGSVDLVWASGVVHHLADQQAAARSLADLLRPEGRVVLVEGGLPLRCLPHEVGPGRPGLESRLDEARSRWFADMRAELQGPSLPYGWPEVLARAGLEQVRSRSFLAERTPPLDPVGRATVERHLSAALDELGDRLDADDRAALTRLLSPDDPVSINHRTDLTVTAARTVHVGTRRR